MNRLNHMHYAAVVSVFVIAYQIAQITAIKEVPKIEDELFVQPFDLQMYNLIFPEAIDYNSFHQMRRKRGFLWSNDDDDDKKTTSSADTDASTTTTTTKTTTAVTTTKIADTIADKMDYFSSVDSIQSDKIHVISIGSDVENSLVIAAPYLPLVNKLATYLVPSLSLYDIVTLSVNMAALTTIELDNYAGGHKSLTTMSAKVASKTFTKALQTKPDADATTFGQYATGIFDKLKNAFQSHFGSVPNLIADKETIESQTDSIFDKVKNKIHIVSNYINGYDAPETESNENKIETIVTKAYVQGSQLPNTDTIVTKTYENGAETLQQLKGSGINLFNIATNLIEDGKNVDVKITKVKKEMNSNESNDFNFETYYHDDEDENISDNEIKINKDDFNKVIQESMVHQPDFLKTLTGEELLKHIDELQKPLPKSDVHSRKVFTALIETFYFDEDVDADQVLKLVDTLEKIANYFISTALENNGLLTTSSNN